MDRSDFVQRGEVKVDFLKNYRLISRWACKNNELSISDLELLFYLEGIGLFKKQDFKDGVHSYSWDNRRWNRLLKDDWIKVFRTRNRTTQKYNIYKLSFKAKQLIARIYRIILGEEDIPETTRSNKIMNRDSYSNTVLATSILNLNKDKTRFNGL